MGVVKEERVLKPLPCHRGLLSWVKISVMGQGNTMGQQRREPLLSLCFAWLAGGKEKGKETMNQKLMMAVCGKGGYPTRNTVGLHKASQW